MVETEEVEVVVTNMAGAEYKVSVQKKFAFDRGVDLVSVEDIESRIDIWTLTKWGTNF